MLEFSFVCVPIETNFKKLTQNFTLFSVALMKAQEQLYEIQTEVKRKVKTNDYMILTLTETMNLIMNFNFNFSLILSFTLNLN